MKRLLGALGALYLMLAGAFAAPAVDGSAGAYCGYTVTTCAATLTTSGSSDLILAFFFDETPGSIGPNLSSVTASGLTFTQVTSQTHGRNHIEVWAAQASGALSAKTITANINAGMDSGGFIVLGVSGLAATNWHDNGGDLPKIAYCDAPGSGCIPSTTMTTSKANDIIFVLGGCSTVNCMGYQGTMGFSSNCDGHAPQPSGFALVGCTYNWYSSNQYSFIDLSYKVVSSVQSAVAVAHTQSFQYGGDITVLALTSDGAAGGGGGFLLLGAGR